MIRFVFTACLLLCTPLAAASDCPGDVNGDWMVNMADLSIVTAHYGMTKGATLEQGDLTGDGAVNQDDLDIVLDNYGKNCFIDVAFQISIDAPVKYTVKIEKHTVKVERDLTFVDYTKLLEPLDPLPKIHYSWPLPVFKLMQHPPLLSEYIRITGAASLSAAWSPYEYYKQLKPFLDLHNAKLGLNYSPLHHKVPAEGELLDLQGEIKLDVQAFIDSMNQAKKWADSLGLTVGCILLDSERFWSKPEVPGHDDYLDATYNRYYDYCKLLWPTVPVMWYGRGAVQPSDNDSGWRTSRRFTLRERGDYFSCSNYHPGNHYLNQEILRRTYQHSTEHGSPKIAPWISIGAGYIPQVDTFHRWNHTWDYDLIYSWKLGAEVNHPWFGDPIRWERFAPWSEVEFVAFYPEPFGRTKKWGTHFVAYVRGAHRIRTLP
jgi:hypothetical protein